MSRVSRSVVVTLVVLASALLSGCGGGGPERLSQDELFDKVVAAQAKAGSSHVAMSLRTPQGQSVNSHGEMRYGTKPSDTALAMTVGQDPRLGDVEIRLVDRAYYIRVGAFTGKKFAKIDLTDKNNPIAREYGDVIENIDPGRQIRQYEGAVTSFDNEGQPVKLDGVQTTPYKVTVDPSKVKGLKGLAGANITYVLYVGPDNLPRRMVSSAPQSGSAPGARLQIDYTGWGDKVVIEAPSKAQIDTDGPLSKLGD
jgi:hypothetical protein